MTETATLANVRQAVPFFGVHDIAKSVRFYVDGLGFELAMKWEPEGRLRWCLLKHGGASLMLQEFWTAGEYANVPTDKLGVGVITIFFCHDALAIYHHAKARGLSPARPFVGNNMWVVSFVDPDGYRLDFESDTDVAEGTEYEE